MVVSDLYDHSELHGSGSGDVAAALGATPTTGEDCGHFNEPLGMAPPKFLCWALAIFMVATQVVFWVVSLQAH